MTCDVFCSDRLQTDPMDRQLFLVIRQKTSERLARIFFRQLPHRRSAYEYRNFLALDENPKKMESRLVAEMQVIDEKDQGTRFEQPSKKPNQSEEDGVPQFAIIFPVRRFFLIEAAPSSIVLKDLDGDNILDMAVANNGAAPFYLGQGVSVLLGNSDGTFNSATYFLAGAIPFSIAIEDLDDNGIPDLAVANLKSDNLSVLLGKGDGQGARAAADIQHLPMRLGLKHLDKQFRKIRTLHPLGKGGGAFVPVLLFLWFPALALSLLLPELIPIDIGVFHWPVPSATAPQSRIFDFRSGMVSGLRLSQILLSFPVAVTFS